MATMHEEVLASLGPRIIDGSLAEGTVITLEWLGAEYAVSRTVARLMPMDHDFDLILVGGGLASSLIAWRLAMDRPEVRVGVVEREKGLGEGPGRTKEAVHVVRSSSAGIGGAILASNGARVRRRCTVGTPASRDGSARMR